LSGVWIVIWVGGDEYFCSCVCAAATPPEPDDDAFVAVDPDEPDEPEELDELEEPQAASARAMASIPPIAANPRTRGRPPRRRSSVGSCVM
jgi:hypothetical protein